MIKKLIAALFCLMLPFAVSAQGLSQPPVQIQNLPQANTVQSTDLLIVGQGGAARKATVQQVQGAIVAGVSSFKARTGAVVPQTGDYTAAQVTGALQAANNLSDVASASTALNNLGIAAYLAAGHPASFSTLAASGLMTFTGVSAGTQVSCLGLSSINTVVSATSGGVTLPVSLANGGTAAALTASNGGIVYSTATTLAVLAGTAVANDCLLSGSNTAPTWGACAGGAAVASVSPSGGSLTISPNTGNVLIGVNLGNPQTWTGKQTFVGPALGTPASGVMTNVTGLPISTGLTGAGTGVLTALGVNVGTAGSFIVNGGALGKPSSGDLTNAINLPVATGISGFGSGVATALAAGVTGSGNIVLQTSPTLATPILGVAAATSINGLVITTTTGTLTLTNAKTFSVANTLTLSGTDGSTLNVGAGGTLASAAYVATGTSGNGLCLQSSACVWSGGQSSAPVTLTYAATVTPDVSTGNVFTITLTGNVVFANPANPVAGDPIDFTIVQDGTGSRTATWGTSYYWAGGGAPTLSVGAGAIDGVTCISITTVIYKCNFIGNFLN